MKLMGEKKKERRIFPFRDRGGLGDIQAEEGKKMREGTIPLQRFHEKKGRFDAVMRQREDAVSHRRSRCTPYHRHRERGGNEEL